MLTGFSNRFLAYGTANATLLCETDVYTNPNWTIGSIYTATTTNCNLPPLTVAATVDITP
jgi:hypothetical protein